MNQVEQSRLPDIDTRLAEARAKTWAAVETIAGAIVPGMTELQAIKMAQATLAEQGCKKFWHRCHVRFGKGTTLSWADAYADCALGADDIFYVDIGPVWDGIEGDAGTTYTTGDNSRLAACRQDVRTIFQAVSDHWRDSGSTGVDLYAFAKGEAERKGWVLAPSYVQGHRLAEFPHSFYTEMHLADAAFRPAPKRWMLEIHICDPGMGFGAFHEDLLGC
jgi:Xaa-Pro aminopeptidase